MALPSRSEAMGFRVDVAACVYVDSFLFFSSGEGSFWNAVVFDFLRSVFIGLVGRRFAETLGRILGSFPGSPCRLIFCLRPEIRLLGCFFFCLKVGFFSLSWWC